MAEKMPPPEKLPDWVPSIVKEHYRRIYTGENGDPSGGLVGSGFGLIAEYGKPKSELAPVVTGLCFGAEMERFWVNIGKAYAEKGVAEGAEERLFRKILQAYFLRTIWDSPLSPKDQRRKLRSLSGAAKKAANLEDLCFPTLSAQELFRPLELEAAASRLPAVKVDQLRKALSSGLYVPPEALLGSPPLMAELLRRLSEYTDAQSENERSLVKREGDHGKNVNLFAQMMARHFVLNLGGPHCGNIAILASALYGPPELDKSTIEGMIAPPPHTPEDTLTGV